jgi:hypothetical protein
MTATVPAATLASRYIDLRFGGVAVMARFVGPRHKLYQAEVQRVVEPAPASVEPADTAPPAVEDRGWFDSTWELRQGLDVAELADFPAGSPVKFGSS